MKAKIGSFAWAIAHQGKLSTREKIQLFNKVILANSRNFLKTHVHFGHQKITLDFEKIRVPDTVIVQEAIQTLNASAHNSLIQHSWRSYFFGAALGMLHQHDFDQEILLTSALCHDLGFTPHHQQHANCACFSLNSALAFQKIAEKVDYPMEKTRLIQEAICMHMNGFNEPSNASEVTLLQYGTACDVIGEQFNRLPIAWRDQILQDYPRENFNAEFTRLIQQERKRIPSSRTALLSTLGLPLMIRLNPFKS